MPVPLKLTRRSDGVVVGGAKPVPMMVTSRLSQCASGPVAARTVGSLFVIWMAPSFVVLWAAPTLVTVTSRFPGDAPGATLRVAVIWLGLSTLTPAVVTPGPKDAVALLAKLAPAMTTTRPVAPCAAVVGDTVVMIGPAADVTIVAFCTVAGVTPGLGPEIVVGNAAEVTPSGRKPGATSTAIPETRI